MITGFRLAGRKAAELLNQSKNATTASSQFLPQAEKKLLSLQQQTFEVPSTSAATATQATSKAVNTSVPNKPGLHYSYKADKVLTKIDSSQIKFSQKSVNMRDVERYTEQMKQKGWIGDPVDVVSHEGNYYLIDGHHRLAAAKRLNIPVPIRIVEDLSSHKCSWNTVEELVQDSLHAGADKLRLKIKN